MPRFNWHNLQGPLAATLVLTLGFATAMVTASLPAAPAPEAEDDPFAPPTDHEASNDGSTAIVEPNENEAPAREAPSLAVKCPNESQNLPAEQKIRQELSEATSMDFSETPLADVVEYLRDLHGIEIQLDTKAMDAAGMSTDTPVTRTIKGISLRSALKLLLSSLDMTAVTRDGVLLITTDEAARKMIEVRVYNVEDLLDEKDAGIDDLADALRAMLCDPLPRDSEESKKGESAVGADPVQIMPFRNLLLVRAPILEHDRLSCLLAQMQRELDPAN